MVLLYIIDDFVCEEEYINLFHYYKYAVTVPREATRRVTGEKRVWSPPLTHC
jgi:hypothetical protein